MKEKEEKLAHTKSKHSEPNKDTSPGTPNT